jgi:hypothetical protein
MLAGIVGVDFLGTRQTSVAADIEIEPTTALRRPDRLPAASISGISHDSDPAAVKAVDQPMLASGAHVVVRAGQRGRGPHQPTCRVRENLHVHPVPLVLAGVERPVIARGHADVVDRQQGAVEDDERLAAGQVERVVQGRCDGGEDVDAFGRRSTAS